MKKYLRKIIVIFLLILGLTACSGDQEELKDNNLDLQEITIVDAVEDELIANVVEAPTALPDYDGLFPPPDLTLVANSGKPQFITSYSNW